MVDPSPSPEPRLIGAGFDTWAGSPFVQARLALLGKTVFALSFGFWAVVNAMFLPSAGSGSRRAS